MRTCSRELNVLDESVVVALRVPVLVPLARAGKESGFEGWCEPSTSGVELDVGLLSIFRSPRDEGRTIETDSGRIS